jgi:hypothetical protein
MDRVRWSSSAAACLHGPTASSAPAASPRSTRQSLSPIGMANSTDRPTPAVAGRAEPAASLLRAASSSLRAKRVRPAPVCGEESTVDDGVILRPHDPAYRAPIPGPLRHGQVRRIPAADQPAAHAAQPERADRSPRGVAPRAPVVLRPHDVGGLDGDTRPAVFVPACWSLRPRIRWQDVEEVWFAGAHADVGGGYDPAHRSPADVSLRWMREEARAHGLLLKEAAEAEALATEIVSGHLHDELGRHVTVRDWAGRMFWKGLERCPRKDLDNEPPPPRTYFRMGPAGPRVVGDSTRAGRVAVHASAPPHYRHGRPPWAGLNVRLVETVTCAVPIPAVTCECRRA